MIAYSHTADALAAVFPLGVFGIYPCAHRQKESGIDVIVSIPDDQCFKMLPATRFRGIWLDEFEGSSFFENARNADEVKTKLRGILADRGGSEWLGWSKEGESIPLARSSRGYRLIAIDFIGRRTAYSGKYGHLGGWKSEVLVDRVITARTIFVAKTPYLEDELAPK